VAGLRDETRPVRTRHHRADPLRLDIGEVDQDRDFSLIVDLYRAYRAEPKPPVPARQ
jgi:hypothetical protein